MVSAITDSTIPYKGKCLQNNSRIIDHILN